MPAVIQAASSPNLERLLSARKDHGRALVDAMPVTGNDEMPETKYETELIGGPPAEAIAAPFSLDSGGASRRTAGISQSESRGMGARVDLIAPPPAPPSSQSRGKAAPNERVAAQRGVSEAQRELNTTFGRFGPV